MADRPRSLRKPLMVLPATEENAGTPSSSGLSKPEQQSLFKKEGKEGEAPTNKNDIASLPPPALKPVTKKELEAKASSASKRNTLAELLAAKDAEPISPKSEEPKKSPVESSRSSRQQSTSAVSRHVDPAPHSTGPRRNDSKSAPTKVGTETEKKSAVTSSPSESPAPQKGASNDTVARGDAADARDALDIQPSGFFSFIPPKGNGAKADFGPHGLIGGARVRLEKEMIDYVEKPLKALICDRAGATVLNMCFRMHELMEHDVIIVEDLSMERQPLLSSPALYLLSPENAEGIDAMLSDWEGRPKYKSLHVFWTGRVTEATLRRIALHRSFVKKIETMKDLMVEFCSGEPLFFHLDTKMDFWRLFPVEGASAKLEKHHNDLVQRLGGKLVGVFHTMGCGMPFVHFQASSPTAKAVAENVFQSAESLNSSRLSTSVPSRPILVVVDRSCDVFEALVHHRTYQCLADEFVPFENGCYTQTYQNGREERKRVHQVDDRDEYWCRYRHEPFVVCATALDKELKSLIAANPALANEAQRGTGLAVSGNAMRSLPDFLARQSKLSMHVDICSRISQEFRNQNLQDVVELELDLLLRRVPVKQALQKMKELGKDLTRSVDVRVRLLTLCFSFLSEKDMSHDARLRLVDECGLKREMVPILRALSLAVRRISSEFIHDLKHYHDNHDDDTPAKAQSQITLFPSYVQHIIDEAIENDLDRKEFPCLNDEGGIAKWIKEHRGAPSSLHVRGREKKRKDNFLNLGYEGDVVLQDSQKVVIFFVGGVTYGEARAAYDISKARGREVMVGGCHVLKPKDFLKELERCGLGEEEEEEEDGGSPTGMETIETGDPNESKEENEEEEKGE